MYRVEGSVVRSCEQGTGPNSRFRKSRSLNEGASTKGKYGPEGTVYGTEIYSFCFHAVKCSTESSVLTQ